MSVRSSMTRKFLALQTGALVLVAAGAFATGPATATAIPAQPVGDLFFCTRNSTKIVTLAWSTTVCPRGTRKFVVPIRSGSPGPAGPAGPAGSPGAARRRRPPRGRPARRRAA